MKKFLIALLALAGVGFYTGYEAKIFHLDFLRLGLRFDHHLQIGLALVALLTGYLIYLILANKVGFKKYKSALLVLGVIALAGASTTAGFINNQPRFYNVALFGAPGDGVRKVTGSTTASSPNFSCLDCTFSPSDVGKIIEVDSVGTSHAALNTTIATYVSAAAVTLTANATFTRTGTAHFFYGTECGTGIQAAILSCDAGGGGTVYHSNGIYCTNKALVTSDNNGKNPNAQIYIPSPQYPDSSRKEINIAGESNIIYPTDYYAPVGTILGNTIPTTGAVIKSFLVSASGTNPSLIGTASGTTATTFNLNDINFSKITLEVATNSGASAPVLTAMNMAAAAHVCLTNVVATIDVSIVGSTDAGSSGTAGFLLSSVANEGQNLVTNSEAAGFQYGMVISEHSILNGYSAYGCTNALELPHYQYMVIGKISTQACNHAITFGTAMGQSGGSATVDLEVENEVTTTGVIGAHWYNAVDVISDPSNFGYGKIHIRNLLNGSGLQPDQIIAQNGGINLSVSHVVDLDLGQNFGYSETDLQQNVRYNDGLGSYKYRNADYASRLYLSQGALSYITYSINGSAINGTLPGNVSSFYVDTSSRFNINTGTPISSAQFQVASTTRGGIALPIMTTTQKNAISSPVDGLSVYDATLHQPFWYENGVWTTPSTPSTPSWDNTLTVSLTTTQEPQITSDATTHPSMLLGAHLSAQSFDLADQFIGGNMYYNAGYRSIGTGPGSMFYFINGGLLVKGIPTTAAATVAASNSTSLIIDSNLNVGFGGNMSVTGAATNTFLSGSAATFSASKIFFNAGMVPSGAATDSLLVGSISSGVLQIKAVVQPIAGQTSLSSGTKAVSITAGAGVSSSSKAFVTLVSQSGTVTTTIQYIAVCTTNTVTISAVTTAGTNALNTLDGSTVNYLVYP